MNTMKKMVGSALLGLAVLGGTTSIGIGTAAADPGGASAPSGQDQQSVDAGGGGDQQSIDSQGRTQGGPDVSPSAAAVWGAGAAPASGSSAPASAGTDPGWDPGPVVRDGQRYQPVWSAAQHHWGIWEGRVWVPVG